MTPIARVLSAHVSVLAGVLVSLVTSGCCPGETLSGGELASEKLRCLHTPETLGGYGIIGVYQYCDHFETDGTCSRLGTPVIRLDSGGGGVFQSHGVTPQKMQWAVLGDGAGAVEIERADPNFRYVFAWKTLDDSNYDCSPSGSSSGGLICEPANNGKPTNDPKVGVWQSANFTFKVSSGNVLLLGERVKSL